MITKLITPGQDTKVHVEQDTQFVLDLPENSENTSYSVELIFSTEGVSAEVVALYKMREGSKVSLTTIANHLVPHTSCMTKVKSVLMEDASSDYIGKILITKNAQQTSSFLQDDVLVLGQNTKNNSQPILEIEADDVKASHGATTGRIDESQVYYLSTRGLDKHQAEELIVEGFFESLLSTIVDENVQNYIRKKLL